MFLLTFFLKSKQKRNSCIAVMNEFSAQNLGALNNNNSLNLSQNLSGNVSSALNSSQFATQNVNNSNNASISSHSNSIMRDSVSSFQSYVLSSSMASSSTSERGNKPNRKFRNIAQISSMFANYNNPTRIQIVF